MTGSDIKPDPPKMRWSVDPDWFARHGRSLSALLRGCLCDGCRKKLDKGKNPSDGELINCIRGCCHNGAGFITAQMPILESIFRSFIASGHEALTVEEMAKQLRERRSGDVFRTSEEILLRLLQDDRYYGFRAAD